MKSEMTPRERMLAVYNGNPTDRPALGIYQRYLPRGMEEIQARVQGLGLICYYPVSTMMAPPWHFYEGYISEVKNVELNVNYFWENGKRMERRCYSTPVGSLTQESCLDPGGVGSEYIRKHYITCLEDYKIMEYIVQNTVFTPNHEHISHSMQDLGQAGVMLGRVDRSPYQKCLIELAGPEQFLIDLFTDTQEVEALLQIMGDKMYEALSMSLDTPADLFWQPDNITSDMTPPDAFEKYCLPFYQKYAQAISETGKPYFIHIDGKFRRLAELLSKTGISGIESISIPEMGGDLKLEEAQELLPDMVLIPNFPSSFSNCEEDVILRFTEELREVSRQRSLMLQISEDIPAHSWKRVVSVLSRAFI